MRKVEHYWSASSTHRNEELTLMRNVLPQLHIAMPTSSNMKVSLHLISFQTAKYPTAVWSLSSPQLRCFWKLPASFVHVAQDMPNVLILLFLRASPPVIIVQTLVLPSFLLPVRPQRPTRVIFGQQISSQDPICRCVLDIDMEVSTPHCHHNI